MEYLPLVVLALLFWFLILRPQRRRTVRQGALLASLEPGQEIVTVGGLHGRIERIDGDEISLAVAPNTVVRVDRRAVARTVERAAEPENRR